MPLSLLSRRLLRPGPTLPLPRARIPSGWEKTCGTVRNMAGGSRPRRNRNHSNEESMIGQAINRMRGKYTNNIVVEVINAWHVDWAQDLFPCKDILREASLRIRVLTRADHLSKEALQYQMHRARTSASRTGKDIAVVAMDVSQAHTVKLKQMKPFLEVLAGAQEVVGQGERSIVVCGLPNAGKSSLIHALTKSRTMEVKKKKETHLPKVSAQAGFTMGTKSHSIYHPHNKKKLISLLDTPGLRSRLEYQKQDQTANLLAVSAMEIPKGYLQDEELRRAIVQQLFDGLERYRQIDSNPNNLKLEDLMPGTDYAANDVRDLILAVRNGSHGGLVMERSKPLKEGADQLFPIAVGPNMGSPVVAMNGRAKYLQLVGAGKKESVRETMDMTSKEDSDGEHQKNSTMEQKGKRPRDADKREKRSGREATARETMDMRTRRETNVKQQQLQKSTNEQKDKRSRKADKDKQNGNDISRLPEYQEQRLKCIQCAGFIKRKKNLDFRGTSYQRITSWSEEDIRQFFTRACEAFGHDPFRHGHVQYLMKDSFVRTLAHKWKLRSRRKVYKKLGGDLGGYPVPNEKRRRLFQKDSRVPLQITKCRNQSQEACWRHLDSVEYELRKRRK